MKEQKEKKEKKGSRPFSCEKIEHGTAQKGKITPRYPCRATFA